jgi:hypothetical protein
LGEDKISHDKSRKHNNQAFWAAALRFLSRRDMEYVIPIARDSANCDVFAVSPSRAARLMGLGRTSVYKLISDDKLKSLKIHGRRLITIEAIRDCLKAHEVSDDQE